MIKAYSKNGLNLLQIMYITCLNKKKDFLKKKQGQLCRHLGLFSARTKS